MRRDSSEKTLKWTLTSERWSEGFYVDDSRRRLCTSCARGSHLCGVTVSRVFRSVELVCGCANAPLAELIDPACGWNVSWLNSHIDIASATPTLQLGLTLFGCFWPTNSDGYFCWPPSLAPCGSCITQSSSRTVSPSSERIKMNNRHGRQDKLEQNTRESPEISSA